MSEKDKSGSMPGELRTPRLLLRRPNAGDQDAVLALHSDSRAVAHNPGDSLSTEAGARALLRRWLRHWERFGFGYYTVLDRDMGAIVGFCGLKVISALGQQALNLFYRFVPEVWGRGLASEAAAAVVGRAEEHLAGWPLIARVRPANTASRTVAEKTGFRLVAGQGVVGSDGYEDTFVRSWPAPLEELALTFEDMALALRTDRLWLTPIGAKDAAALRAVVAEREGPTPSVEAVGGGIAKRERDQTGLRFYALRADPNADLFGYCGTLVGRATLEEPEIAYEVHSSMRNRGFASEAAGAVIEAARATGRRRLWSTVRTWNEPSLRVLHKHGFVRDHVRLDDGEDLIYLRKEL